MNRLSRSVTPKLRRQAKSSIEERKPRKSSSLEKLKELAKNRSFSPVFGANLEFLVKVQQTSVPFFVQDAIEYLEKHGLEEEGLFRIPGTVSEIAFLQHLYNDDRKRVNLISPEVESKLSPHSVASALKVFFRKLPEPLLTYRFYSVFIKVEKNGDKESQMQNLRLLVQGLPKPNKDTLIYLMRFLSKITDKEEKNKMSAYNLAICWAPTLMRAPSDLGNEQAAFESQHIVSIVSTLIQHIEYFAQERNNMMRKIKHHLHPDPKEGWAVIFKKSWKKRWIVLKENSLLYSRNPKDTPKFQLALYGSFVSEANELAKKFSLKIESAKGRVFFLSLSSNEERREWFCAIQNHQSAFGRSNSMLEEEEKEVQELSKNRQRRMTIFFGEKPPDLTLSTSCPSSIPMNSVLNQEKKDWSIICSGALTELFKNQEIDIKNDSSQDISKNLCPQCENKKVDDNQSQVISDLHKKVEEWQDLTNKLIVCLVQSQQMVQDMEKKVQKYKRRAHKKEKKRRKQRSTQRKSLELKPSDHLKR